MKEFIEKLMKRLFLHTIIGNNHDVVVEKLEILLGEQVDSSFNNDVLTINLNNGDSIVFEVNINKIISKIYVQESKKKAE